MAEDRKYIKPGSGVQLIKLNNYTDPPRRFDVGSSNRLVRVYAGLNTVYFSRSTIKGSCYAENADQATIPIQRVIILCHQAMTTLNIERGNLNHRGIYPEYVLGINTIKSGKHLPNSYHYSGNAVDFSFRNMMTGQRFSEEHLKLIYRNIKKEIFLYEISSLDEYFKLKKRDGFIIRPSIALVDEIEYRLESAIWIADVAQWFTVSPNGRKIPSIEKLKKDSPSYYEEIVLNNSHYRNSQYGKVYVDSWEKEYKNAESEIVKIYGKSWRNVYKEFSNEDSSLNWFDSSTTLSRSYRVLDESGHNHIHIQYSANNKIYREVTEVKKETYLTVKEDDPKPKPTYYTYIHNDFGITTLDQLLQKEFSQFATFSDKRDELLNYSGDTGTSNRQRISAMYTPQDKSNVDIISDVSSTNYIKVGTQILIPAGEITRSFLTSKDVNQSLPYTGQPAFISEYISKIVDEPGYSPSVNISNNSTYAINNGSVGFTVWIYIRSLDKILDISHFIQSVSTNNTKQLSSFNFTMVSVKDIVDLIKSNTIYSSTNIDGSLNHFHRYINENDIVWIRFEELDCELSRKRRPFSFEVGEDELADNIYDLIGLVDKNSSNLSFESADDSVKITGRDFSKIFVDDEALFFPLAVVQNSEGGNLFIGNNQDDKILQRTFSSADFDVLFGKTNRSIFRSMTFYLNQLSNIGVLPDNQNDTFFLSYRKSNEKGILVDRRSRIFRLNEGQGSVVTEGVDEKNQQITTKLHNGIYQIIKLSIDPLISDRRLVDSTITNPQGNILSLFNKLCKEPFVELYMDTYGDIFNIIARKPPFDYASVMSYLEYSSPKGKSYAIIDIEGSSVSNVSLDFDNESLYTWFKYEPKGLFFGQSDQVALTYMPIVFFSQLIDIWGSRPLSVESNYTQFDPIKSDQTNEKFLDFKDQAINDMVYIIESHIYRPFTRKGTIKLSVNDRRIKKGSWIRYKPTGEIFYVNETSNFAKIDVKSVDTGITLNVSHGMVEKHIRKNKIISQKNGTFSSNNTLQIEEGVWEDELSTDSFSYFNIVDLEKIKTTLLNYMKRGSNPSINKTTSISQDFKVNQDVLDFFLQRKQFD